MIEQGQILCYNIDKFIRLISCVDGAAMAEPQHQADKLAGAGQVGRLTLDE
jgi:hypothetical protein